MAYHSIYHLSVFMLGQIFLSTPMMAYVEPASWVIQQMARKCLDRSTKLKGILSTNLNFKDDSFVELSLGSTGLNITKTNPVLAKKSSEESSEKRPFPIFILNVLSDCSKQSEQGIAKYLSTLKIDTNKISLGFLDNDIVYIIGADPGDDSLPQLWVDKNSFSPVREKTATYEVSFRKWRDLPNISRTFPHVIVLTKNGQQQSLSLAEQL